MDDDSSGGSGRQQLQAKSKEGPNMAARHEAAASHAKGSSVTRGGPAQSSGSLKAEKETAATTTPGKAAVSMPASPPPVKPAPSQNPPSALVQIPSVIRHKSTPEKMTQHRIPPKAETLVNISVNNLAAGNAPVRIYIEDANAGNGLVGIDGDNQKMIMASGTYELSLRGAKQTAPGSGGKLRLAAEQNGNRIAQSGGFSVSAIPETWSTKFKAPIDTPGKPNSWVGISVTDAVFSDVGSHTYLDEVLISECVSHHPGKGFLNNSKKITSKYQEVSSDMWDEHAYQPRMHMNEESNMSQTQTAKFHDKRTGAIDIPVKDSGYLIEHNVSKIANKHFLYTIKKTGADVTADSIKSDAGAGEISHSINVP